MGRAGIWVPLVKPGAVLLHTSLDVTPGIFFWGGVVIFLLGGFLSLIVELLFGEVKYFTVQGGFSLEVGLMRA